MSDENRWIAVFNSLDKDGNKLLTRDEIEQCLKSLGVSESFAEKIIKEIDLNKDGKISLDEYLKALRKIPPRDKCSSVERWKEVFQSIDKDNSGKVSAKELDEFLKSTGNDINKSCLENWMDTNDKNKDGELDYAEFLAYVRQTYE
uniref:16 kDa calcium-binding protein (Egg antigen SME16) n=1 Tax=Schistosoma japonicum TaxID=6182 RepID=C1LNV0_SCHJA|nr:16 kDa calcium-binding protein (Egg antigen SME16) [Schistosoma japonicum]